jgi:CRP-like cAMP-binding protein/small-conductance mechanosensitive channel
LNAIPHFGAGDASELWGFLAALALCALLLPTLPPDRRRRLRGPLVLLGFYLVLLVPRSTPLCAQTLHTLALVSGFVLILALIRLFFTVLFDSIPIVRGRFPKIVQDILLGLAYFVTLMGLFHTSGVELSSILTTSALLTAVVAFALQDWVSIDVMPNKYGRVLEINWRVTRLVTNELVEILIPNAIIAKSAVVNFSLPTPVVRRDIRVAVSYDVPPGRVEEVAIRAMRSCPDVLADPPPDCILEAFDDSGVRYWCRFFIGDFGRRDIIVGMVGARLYYEFLREGINIPYPIRTVNLYERSSEQERLAREDRIQKLAERFAAVDFLAPLGSEGLKTLAGRVQSVSYGRGEAIVHEGEAGSDFYLIERGDVAVVLDQGGTRREIARLAAGDFFGEMSLMTGEARRATVLAESDVRTVRVDKDSFRDVISVNPAVVEEMSRILVMRQSDLEERAATVADSEKTVERRSVALMKLIRGFLRL